MKLVKARINQQGRLVIPAAIREAADIRPDSTVLLEVVGKGEIRVRNLSNSVAEARKLVGKYIKRGGRLVDELIEERRREAGRE
ncbi:MAG: AbrB/MazE/SpoVT family DNA-binding domain-containing protein [Pseudomonadota bacterium]